MLRFLRIEHLAVIDALEVEFEPGLNVLTGETGAGKSMLVEAIGLLMGGRASADLIWTAESSAQVQAVFEAAGGEVIVRRDITSQGRSRAFVDDALVTSGVLRDRTSPLVELHGQHEHQTLLDPQSHLVILDEFAGRHRRANTLRNRSASGNGCRRSAMRSKWTSAKKRRGSISCRFNSESSIAPGCAGRRRGARNLAADSRSADKLRRLSGEAY